MAKTGPTLALASSSRPFTCRYASLGATGAGSLETYGTSADSRIEQAHDSQIDLRPALTCVVRPTLRPPCCTAYIHLQAPALPGGEAPLHIRLSVGIEVFTAAYTTSWSLNRQFMQLERTE